MKRLCDLPAEDQLSWRAHALIRAVGATVHSEERLLRVRRLLDAPARAVAPRWGWRVGPALGLLGVSAAAAAGSSAVSSALGIDQPAADDALQGISASRAVLPIPVAAPAPERVERVVEAVRAPSSARSFTPTNAPASRTAAPPLSDVARVHEAAKALRHDGNAERALQLLEHGAPVSGPLAEEALALRIEASVARGNGRQANLATAYLAHYPQGRYRELARKALSGSAQ
jgi:hypothetical protein